MTAQHPMKYLWTSAPPKGGRSTRFGLGLLNRRRTAILRLFILLLAVVTIHWTITSSSESSDRTPRIDNEPTTQKAVSVEVPHAPNVRQRPEGQHVLNRVPSEEDIVIRPQSIGTGEKRDPQFRAALAHIISLLPNEITTRELLRPVEGTGEGK